MIVLKNLAFQVENGIITLSKCGNMENLHSRFAEVLLSGGHKDSHMGTKMILSSEGPQLKFVAAKEDGTSLEILQKSPKTEVKTVFSCYEDCDAFRAVTTVTNISTEPIILEEVSAFTVTGFGGKGAVQKPESYFFTRFLQGHHTEAQPVTHDFPGWGLGGEVVQAQKKLSFTNIGSWSTKEALPLGILENREKGTVLMFQIESCCSWYYEISDLDETYYLYLGGPNLLNGGWSEKLQPGESYETPAVALSFGCSVNEAVGEMTKYRRHICRLSKADAHLPVHYNDYMHFTWSAPTQNDVQNCAPTVARLGAESYIIDCGWHNEEGKETGVNIFHYLGQWKESHRRFPDGLRTAMAQIEALGLKPGLWIEPEVIGDQCREMLEYYDDDCFLQRNGQRVHVWNRYFLDFRNAKVRNYMTEVLRQMIEDYGARYIKIDYNQDCGIGTDRNAFSFGSGLEASSAAYLDWIRSATARYPDVIFETCASGGMRMDCKTLSAFSLLSISDQTDYRKAPWIIGNILVGVLPEQAAIWSYPFAKDCESPQEVSDNRIAMNMVNTFLGRMYLSSRLWMLDDRQLSLVQEGVAYYQSLTEMKKRAVPYFPNGFTRFGEPAVCAGLKDANRLYLAFWALQGQTTVTAKTEAPVKHIKIGYPSASGITAAITETGIRVTFPNTDMAVFLEVELEET